MQSFNHIKNKQCIKTPFCKLEGASVSNTKVTRQKFWNQYWGCPT